MLPGVVDVGPIQASPWGTIRIFHIWCYGVGFLRTSWSSNTPGSLFHSLFSMKSCFHI